MVCGIRPRPLLIEVSSVVSMVRQAAYLRGTQVKWFRQMICAWRAPPPTDTRNTPPNRNELSQHRFNSLNRHAFEDDQQKAAIIMKDASPNAKQRCQ